MNREDFWAGFGALVSTLTAILSPLWSLSTLQSVSSFMAGALVTFLVQSKLQDRAEKRRLRVKYLEEFFIPLFLKVEEIREKQLKDLEEVSGGHDLTKKPEMFTLDLEYRQQLKDFFEISKKISDSLRHLGVIVHEIIHKGFEKHFLPYLIKEKIIEVNDEGTIKAINRATGFGLRLKNPLSEREAPLAACAMLQLNPIQFLRKKSILEVDQISISSELTYDSGGDTKTIRINIPIEKVEAKFTDFWACIVDEIHNVPDVQKFLETRDVLILRSETILDRLRKHINRYVPREKV